MVRKKSILFLCTSAKKTKAVPGKTLEDGFFRFLQKLNQIKYCKKKEF